MIDLNMFCTTMAVKMQYDENDMILKKYRKNNSLFVSLNVFCLSTGKIN